MSGRTQARVFGPIFAMLPVHVLLLVLAARNMPAHGPWQLGDPWTTWNMAAPALLLMAAAYAKRRLDEEEAALTPRLARLSIGATGADLVLTAGWLVLRMGH